MKVKLGFKAGDKVTYKGLRESITAVVVNVHSGLNPLNIPGGTEYEIRVTTNRAKSYRRGEQFRTTGIWLNKR